ncbi:tryptophan synthase subunit alpha [Legionella israelensis]|uniref:Tryptophan synthase alpha chain n=1 Tax=Legionella israelensis TaxID=454 RepID=A0A0W0VVD9_9GAMM|nr:tryptophan synthase subunit alpha [Legionella israelensis]KTD23654.1 tryptophan synthase subunit alpha [Legionella israelensis]QBS08606.1 tryptophan synthase subunit alpha [Legionella israelensis]SCY38604.1 tryptophan synthase, alpha chain [Legionella israelensis DSM 19235]STX58264.1 tryptophan synthase alpha chain [Legionella israelensis]
MNRIDKKLSYLKDNHRKMLSPYITAGDPRPDLTVQLMHYLVQEGADIIELGIPFSDPMAEGPAIQSAMERALAFEVNCNDVLNMVVEFRKQDGETPIVLMGYLNPVEQYGYENFARDAKKSGVDGTILVDLPPEETETVANIWEKNNLYSIYLCSPTTSDNRMKKINQYGKGYLYYVSLKGVTGADTFDIEQVKSDYMRRKSQTDLPLMVGFGIKTAEMAKKVSEFADGVIVGAALISQILTAYEKDQKDIRAGVTLIGNMRKAIDYNGK